MTKSTEQYVDALLDWFYETYNRRIKDPTTRALIAKVHIEHRPTLETCKEIIKMKGREWIGNPKMHKYFHPRTIFRMSNFLKYQEELQDAQNEYDPQSQQVIEHFSKVTGINFLITHQYLVTMSPLTKRLGAQTMMDVVDHIVPRLKELPYKHMLMPENFFSHTQFSKHYNEWLVNTQGTEAPRKIDVCPVCCNGSWNEDNMHLWCRKHTEEWTQQ